MKYLLSVVGLVVMVAAQAGSITGGSLTGGSLGSVVVPGFCESQTWHTLTDFRHDCRRGDCFRRDD